MRLNFDDLVRGIETFFSSFLAKAGISSFQEVLDPGFRRGDASEDF